MPVCNITSSPFVLHSKCGCLVSNQIFTVCVSNQELTTLCSRKSDAKIQITITTAHLIKINYPLSSFNYRLSGTNVVNFNKIHHTVSEQQLFTKWNLKTEFSNMEIPISILTAGSVTNNDIMLVTLL